MNQNSVLFWQPQFNLISLMTANRAGKNLLIFLNYAIWLFFVYISFLLVLNDPNTFWQLLIATVVAEIVEKYFKHKIFWRRPMFERGDNTPPGLVDSWYKSGSFPSGHTIKAVIFFLLVLQFHVFSPILFLIIAVPLIVFRIIAGFHYPADIIGGAVFGLLIWLMVASLQMPLVLNQFIYNLFNFVFRIK